MAIYLDYNATAPIRPEAKAAALAAMDLLGNPASVHAAGRAARALLEQAREDVAEFVAVKPASITFTSGGTESNALAVESAVLAGYERIILGATEHAAVAENARAKSPAIEVWPVDEDGVADLDWLSDALKRPGKAVVCLMLANNETGVIQPVAEASALVREVGAWLHVDAVGAVGKIAIDFNALGADTMALVGHKIGGPFGIGGPCDTALSGDNCSLQRGQLGLYFAGNCLCPRGQRLPLGQYCIKFGKAVFRFEPRRFRSAFSARDKAIPAPQRTCSGDQPFARPK